jgi:hypothetical protein
MVFELVGSAFVCYEVLALRALGVADSRTTHIMSAPIGARSQNEYRYDRYSIHDSITGIVSTVVSGILATVQREVTSRGHT